MFIYSKFWKTNPKWTNLSHRDQVNFIIDMPAKVGNLLQDKVELVGFAVVPVEHDQTGQYMTLWKLSDEGKIPHFEWSLNKIGWHEYFE